MNNTMSLNDFFTLENIETLGTMLATGASVLFIAWKSFQKKIDKYINEKGTNISGKIRGHSAIDLAIVKKIDEVRESLNADRVRVFEFHNGGHYAHGRSALKATCTYETCRYGIKPYQSSLANIPLGCITDFINPLLDNNYLAIANIEDIRTSMPSMYNLKKSMEVTAFYDVVIKNKSGDPVGFISIQFCVNKYNTNEEIIQKLVWFVEEELSSFMC